jgi:hypothetical protein
MAFSQIATYGMSFSICQAFPHANRTLFDHVRELHSYTNFAFSTLNTIFIPNPHSLSNLVQGGEATKMEEDEFYAIETFGSTGRGHVVEVDPPLTLTHTHITTWNLFLLFSSMKSPSPLHITIATVLILVLFWPRRRIWSAAIT